VHRWGIMVPKDVPPQFDLTVRWAAACLRGDRDGHAPPQREGPERRPAPCDRRGADARHDLPAEEFTDSHGNHCYRVALAKGSNLFRHDAIVAVSSKPDNHHLGDALAHSPGDLPPSVLRYTLPSRYCDSDKLVNFAWEKFGKVGTAGPGSRRSAGGCTRTSSTATFPDGPTSPRGTSCSAATGSCRDFAHLAIALNRTSTSRPAMSPATCRTSAARTPRPHGLPRLRRESTSERAGSRPTPGSTRRA